MIRVSYVQSPEATDTVEKITEQLNFLGILFYEITAVNLRQQPNLSVTDWYGLFQFLGRSVKP